MKIIVTGATGFIGSRVLTTLLAHPSVTAVIALTRRPLSVHHLKLTNIIHTDYASYPEDLLMNLDDAKACIWCLGQLVSTHEVEVEYPLAAVRTFLGTGFGTDIYGGQRGFRFVYCSGWLSERDQGRWLAFLGESRRLKGETETKLIELAAQHRGYLEAVIARPGGVVGEKSWVPGWMLPVLGNALRVDQLARVMVDAAVNGTKVETMESGWMRRRGEELKRVESS